jgi:hypothetical protein
MPDAGPPDLAGELNALAGDLAAHAQAGAALAARMADIAGRIWDARLLAPPEGTQVRPRLYPVALAAARRIAARGDKITYTKLFADMRDVDCVTIREGERGPLWEHVNGRPG